MKISSTQFWAGLAVLEALVIVALIASPYRIVVQRSYVPSESVVNPLKAALEYEASDKKFEELVKSGADWMWHRSDIDGKLGWPVLADCAFLLRTNYVRILVIHGADVEKAIKCLKEVNSDDAIALLQQVRTEHGSKTAP